MAAASTAIPMIDNPEGILRELGFLEGTWAARKISFPLVSVDINAQVAERVATVTVKQVFRNSITEHMEAVYIFPLSAGCAVSKFTMTTKDRQVEGIVRERSEARQEYQQALTNGNRAALIEQERDDVFTVQVGNVPPGEEVTIEISYSERLPYYENGKTELRLPLVVSPRYIPGAEVLREQTGAGVEVDTNLVPDASRITPPRVVAGNESDIKLSLNVDIYPDSDDAELSGLECSQHATKMSLRPGALRISLANTREKLNRDFVLRWKMNSENVKTTVLTFTALDGQKYGVLSVVPPEKGGYRGAPRDVIFLVDRSGSMEGIKMSSATRACSILLNTLGPGDRFAIMAFDDQCDWMPGTFEGQTLLNATEANIERGETFLRTINSRGGTELHRAMVAACRTAAETAGRKSSIVVITDGEVGNESQILQEIQRTLGDTRLFAVGIDTAVNAGLLKRLANLGGGTAALVEPGIQLEEALTSIGREIGHPLVTDIQVEGLELSIDRASVSPSRIPDLFAQRASIAFFKWSGNGSHGKFKVKGKLSNGKTFETSVTPRTADIPAVAQLWAKARIVDLEDQFRIGAANKNQLKKQIIELAVQHSLLTKFTAFVAVDKAEVVNEGGHQRQLVQPVEMPADWQMDAAGYSKSDLQNLPRKQSSSLMGQMTRSKQLSTGGANSLGRSSEWDSPGLEDSRAGSATGGWGNAAEAESGGWGGAWAPASAGGGWGTPTPQQQQDDGWGTAAAAQSSDAWSNAAPVQSEERSAPTSSPQPPAPTKREEAAPQGSSSPSLKKDAYGLDSLKERVDKALNQNVSESKKQASAPVEPDLRIREKSSAPVPPRPQAPRAPSGRPADSDIDRTFRKLGAKESSEPSTGDPGSGSYGAGVRAQVLEVIVRQAMAGAPWKEICKGPMTVNSISEEEVQAEVDRRRAQQGEGPESPIEVLECRNASARETSARPQPPAEAKPAKPGLFSKIGGLLGGKFGLENKDQEREKEPTNMPAAIQEFIRVFQEAFRLISQGIRPSADEMEKSRQALVRFLSTSQIGTQVPLLQTFVRSHAIELVGSVQDTSTSLEELLEFWTPFVEKLRNAEAEARQRISAGSSTGKGVAFWEDSV